ncbi:MAG: hypothetical protein MR519_08790 [Spirochaetaceae bacterium]|nr:hypothetical protein [Spirochaetaceae bacterium]
MKKRRLSDNAKAMVCRWYLAGVVYFFVAFGTPLGSRLTTIDLVFTLAAGTGCLTVFVLDPILWRIFDLTEHGKVVNIAYFSRSRHLACLYKLAQFFRCMLCVAMVAFIYHVANICILQLFHLPEGTVALKGEPFLFATLYVALYWVTEKGRLALKKEKTCDIKH